MLNRSLLPTASGIAASGWSTIDMRLGEKVWAVCLELGDNGTSSGAGVVGTISNNVLTANQINLALDNMIAEIDVYINSKPQRRMLGSQLNQLNGINGSRYLAVGVGTPGQSTYRIFIFIFFAEFWRTNPQEIPVLALNLNKKGGPAWTTGDIIRNGQTIKPDGVAYGDVTSCQIKVQWNAITSPALAGYYLWEPVDLSRGLGSICKWEMDSLQFVGLKNDFRLDPKQLIQSIHIWPSVETTPKYVNNMQLKMNGIDIQEQLNYSEIQSYLYMFQMSPDTTPYLPAGVSTQGLGTAPRMDFVADVDDPLLNALPASSASSLRMYLQFSGAAGGNAPLIIQRVGAPD